MDLFNKLWMKALLVGVLVLALGGLGTGIYHAGWSARNETAKAELAEARRQQDKITSTLRLDQQLAKAGYEKEKYDAEIALDAVRAELRAGTRRLSIAGRCRAAAPAAGHPEAQARPDRASAERIDIDPAAGERLIAITRDGDNAIRDLNQCLDAYERARSLLSHGN